jgi:hypothetical protein
MVAPREIVQKESCRERSTRETRLAEEAIEIPSIWVKLFRT